MGFGYPAGLLMLYRMVVSHRVLCGAAAVASSSSSMHACMHASTHACMQELISYVELGAASQTCRMRELVL